MLSNFLVEQVSKYFVSYYSDFISLKINKEIISKGTFEYSLLKILRNYTATYLFTSYEAEKMELSGFSIIRGILDEYLKLISLTKEQFSYLILEDHENVRNCGLGIERRLFNRLPKKHISAYKTSIACLPLNKIDPNTDFLRKTIEKTNEVSELHFRLHLIVDFVSGMTDQFSMEIYQLIKGISIR